MSTTVDQRIVEMRFDNKQFEQNVSTSMSTLDKLKEKLGFKGATKGLQDVGAAAKNVDMSHLGNAVETVGLKFNAMYSIADQALRNITNSAMQAGTKMIKALTLDPITTGFQEYETQINAVQTILANTESKGSTIDDVNVALEELNKYADQTIYNFTEMTRNIGTFTAAGVDLDTSTNAIKGIANLAAVSGSNAQQASTAMYQLSQALASGTVKLMDWNSVVNAGMGGQVFQDALKETARVHGIAIDDMIEEQGSFRETLSEGWLTSEILTETLQKFTLATEGLTEEQIEANREMLRAKGYTDEQIEGIFKLGNTATNAATKVKTFTQLWDVLKESAQSGWSQTWKLVVGDFEEAKELLTPLADTLTGFINKMSDARNRVLQIALDFTTPWKTMTEKLTGPKSPLGKIKEITDTVGDLGDKLEYYQNVVSKVWRGDYKNSDTGRYELLEAAGYDHRVVQDLVNKGRDYKLTVEDIEASHKKFGLTMETTTEETKDAADATEEATSALSGLSDEQLKNAGLTEEEISLYRALESEADRLGISVSELADEMSSVNGRDLLIDAFKNFGDVIVGAGKAAKEAYVEIFNPPSLETLGVKLYGIIRSIKDFSESIRLTNKETGELTETGQKIKSIFGGVFALVHIITSILGGPLKLAINVVTKILSAFGISIIDIAAFIGDALIKIDEWITKNNIFAYAFEGLIAWLVTCKDAFTDWIDSLKDSENLPKDIAEGIVSGFSRIPEFFVALFEQIKYNIKHGFDSMGDNPLSGFIDKIKGGLGIAGDTIAELGKILLKKLNEFLSARGMATISEDSIAGLVQGFKDGASKVWNAAVTMVMTLVEKVKGFLGIHSPSTVFAAIGGFIVAGLVMGLKNGIPDSLGAVKDLIQPMLDWLKTIDLGAVFAGIMGIGMVSTTNKLSNALIAIAEPFSSLSSVFDGVGEVLEGVGKVLKKSARAIASTIKSFSKVLTGFSKVLKANAFETTAKGIKELALALLILVGAIAVLAIIAHQDPTALWNAVGALLAVAAILGILAVVTSKMAKSGAIINKEGMTLNTLGSTLIAMGAAILLMAIALKTIGSLDSEQAKQGFLGLVGVIAAILALLAACKYLVGGELAGNIDKVGATILKISIAMGILVLVTKMIAGMSWGALGKGALGMLGLIGMVALLMKATQLVGPNADKIGGTLIKLSIAMGVLVIVAKMIAGMSWGDMGKAAVGMLGLVAIVGALMLVTRLAGNNAVKIGGTILAIGSAMFILAVVTKILGGMDEAALKKGVACVTVFAAIITGLVAAIRLAGGNPGKIAGSILAMSVSIGLLAAIAILLGFVSVEHLAKGITAVGFLGLIMSAMVAATKGASDCKGNLIVMVVAIGVMAAAVAALSFIDTKQLAVATGALTLLMGTFALLVKATQTTSNVKMGTLIMLVGIVALLGLIVAGLSLIKADASLLVSVAGVSALLLAMTGILYILQSLDMRKFSDKKIIKIGIMLTALVGIIALLGLVLAMMSALNVTSAMSNTLSLTVLLGAMVGALFVMQFVGDNAIKSVGVLALMGLVVAELAVILGLMAAFDIAPSMETVLALSTLMLAMSAACLIVSLVPATAALSGALGLASFVGVMAVVLAALGGLSQIPGFNELIADGGNTLALIGDALGKFVGSIVAGFAGAVLTILPQLGLALSAFMAGVQPFIIGAKMIDASVLEGVGILSAAILALTVADLVAGVSSFLQGGSSFAELGTQLSQFMYNALPFITTAALITPEMLAGVKALAETILILTAANVIEGLASFLTGGSSLETFAKQLPILGTGLSAFALSLGAFTEDQLATVNCAAQAVKTLAQASAEIPNSGGLLAAIVGENDLSTFAAQFPILGSGLALFLSNIGTFTEEQVATVNCAAQAIKALAQASSEIPNSGGLLAQIVGENDLGTFANQFPILGTGLRGFLDNVGTFTEEQVATVDCAAKAIKTLAQASSEIPNSGGWIGAIVGENDLGTFADQFPKLGTGLAGFLGNVGTFTEEQVATVDCAANAVKTLASVASSIPNEGGWLAKIVGDNNLGTFADNFPKLGEGLAGFASKIGTFTDAQVSTVNAAVRAVKALTGLANADLSGAKKNLSGFSDKLPGFGTDLGKFCSNMPSTESTSAAVSNLKKILSAVKSIASANSGPLATFATNLKKIGKDAVKKFVEAFTSSSAKTDLKNAAKKLGDQVVDGIEAKESAIKKAAKAAAGKGVTGVRDKYSSMKSAGKYLVEGFAAGITEKTWHAEAKAKAMANAAEKAAKDALDINSPSKVFRAIGYSVPEGFAMGIDRMGGMVTSSSSAMAKNAINNVRSSISRISDMVGSDIDAQPTIRPVLDLSDVKSGVNAMSGMLDVDSSVGIRANIGAISSMMSVRGQNGSNADVVSAIDKLRKDLANSGGDTYSINGITYDNGSNVNNAIATIVRAARIERRV